MKTIALLCLFLVIYGGTCPNLCSGHGTCTRSGTCNCYPGWILGDCSQRTCPYDHPYNDPTADTDPSDRIDLECSGQGNCNRESGLCECFPGYEGTACQRTSCPNMCSGHGVCTAVDKLTLNEQNHENIYYEKDTTVKYVHWDDDQSYACVCDKEYTGYDCSKKRCPVGYIPSSDCDAPSQNIETITLSKALDNSANTPLFAYAKYTDTFGRVWYTSAFDITAKDAFLEALLKLPSGTIDIESVEHTVGSNTITITFGKSQTGRQEIIELLGLNDVVENAPGEHGLSKEDLKSFLTKDQTDDDVLKYTLCSGNVEAKEEIKKLCSSKITVASYEFNDSIPPLPCSRNGICDHNTGLCTCFTGFYGLACTEQAALI